jgi:hypothetical protein
VQAALNGLAMAVEKLGDVTNAAVSESERFGGGEEPTLSLVEGREGELHGLFDWGGVWRKHQGILPKRREILFQDA